MFIFWEIRFLLHFFKVFVFSIYYHILIEDFDICTCWLRYLMYWDIWIYIWIQRDIIGVLWSPNYFKLLECSYKLRSSSMIFHLINKHHIPKTLALTIPQIHLTLYIIFHHFLIHFLINIEIPSKSINFR